MSLKATNTTYLFISNALLESTSSVILKTAKASHLIYPPGKPKIHHFLVNFQLSQPDDPEWPIGA